MNTKTVNASASLTNPSASPISTQLEGMLGVVRRLESELDQERKKNQRLAQEYIHARSHLENSIRQIQEQMKNRETTTASVMKEKDDALARIRSELAQAKAGEDRLQTMLQEISDMEKKTREELSRFQNAWGEVLGREAQAKKALQDSEQNRQEVDRIRSSIDSLNQRLSQAQKVEAHCRGELDKAVNRILAAEEQASRLHQSLQGAEASALRANGENRGLRDENQKLSNHVARLIRENATLEGRARQAQERHEEENRERAAEITRLARDEARETITELEKQVNLARLEIQQVLLQNEESRKRMSKDFLVEKLRSDAEAKNLLAVNEKLRQRVDELESRDLVVEKIEGEVSGQIYTAQPVQTTSASASSSYGANPPSARENEAEV